MIKDFFYKAGGHCLIKKLVHNHILVYTFFMFLLLPKNRFGFEILSNLIENKIYKKLRRKYKDILNKSPSQNIDCSGSAHVNRIWFCWFQGLENAPELVKTTYRKLQAYNTDKEIIVITNDNFKNYTNIPDYIVSKWKKGIISNTHFSDILRTNLLVQNGGYWVDATVFFASQIPSDIEKSDFFCFKTLKPGCAGHSVNVSSWFLYSNKSNPIMVLVQNLLFEYWKKKKYLCDYFLFHLFLEMAMEKHSDLIQSMPSYTNENPHILFYNLDKKYDSESFYNTLAKSFVHKLSYKLDEEINKSTDTFYAKIISGNF